MSDRKSATRKILSDYRRYMSTLEPLIERIDSLDDRAHAMKGQKLDAMPRGGQPHSCYDVIDEKVDLEHKHKHLLMIARQKREIVERYIESVTAEPDKTILQAYYVECVDIITLADWMHCTVRHAYRRISQAANLVDINLNL